MPNLILLLKNLQQMKPKDMGVDTLKTLFLFILNYPEPKDRSALNKFELYNLHQHTSLEQKLIFVILTLYWYGKKH